MITVPTPWSPSPPPPPVPKETYRSNPCISPLLPGSYWSALQDYLVHLVDLSHTRIEVQELVVRS